MMPALVTLAFHATLFGVTPGDLQAPVRVASKNFTESVILGEITTLLARSAGAPAVHEPNLGGTRVLWNALLSGEIDVYPEYTGTITQEILADRKITGAEQLSLALGEFGVVMSAPLGFNNTYALGMRKDTAARLGVGTISDLRAHPELKLGFSNEFMDRGDGWPSLRRAYDLPHQQVRGLEHDLAYRALDDRAIDVMDLYATDAEIAYYDLAVLEDDRRFFPDYDAVLLYREDLARRAPQVVAELNRLAGRISDGQMQRMNRRAKIERQPAPLVAADFLADQFELDAAANVESATQRLLRTTREHLHLVAVSLIAAIAVAIPLGVLAARQPRSSQTILSTVGIIQTIPALALLVLLMAALRPLAHWGISSIGEPPAILALFLYSLLPIVRNTYSGITEIPPNLRESAEALGLTPLARLWRIDLPLASPLILAGIKIAAVTNVGFATLGALIGAGGYGQPILTGIRLDRIDLILQGAVPAAVLALLVQGLFELLERIIVPRGLRLRP